MYVSVSQACQHAAGRCSAPPRSCVGSTTSSLSNSGGRSFFRRTRPRFELSVSDVRLSPCMDKVIKTRQNAMSLIRCMGYSRSMGTSVPVRDYHDLKGFIWDCRRRVVGVHPVPGQDPDAADYRLQVLECDLCAAVRSRDQKVRCVPAYTHAGPLACRPCCMTRYADYA